MSLYTGGHCQVKWTLLRLDLGLSQRASCQMIIQQDKSWASYCVEIETQLKYHPK